jgi:hypothetical protein
LWQEVLEKHEEHDSELQIKHPSTPA